MRNRRQIIYSILLVSCQLYLFGSSAYWAFARHDAQWAMVAAFLLGSLGINTRQLVIETRARTKKKDRT